MTSALQGATARPLLGRILSTAERFFGSASLCFWRPEKQPFQRIGSRAPSWPYMIASTISPMNACSFHPTGPDPTRATTRSSDGMT